MEIAFQIILLIAGFVALIKGADWLVDGASSTASHFKVSKLLIGLTIVAFGTGAPEFAVSISSLLSGSTDVLLGNVIGSNILNILLLIGIGALIYPIKIHRDTVVKELPILLLVSIGLIVLFLDTFFAGADANIISRGDGIVCLLFFGIFLYYIISLAKKNREMSGKDVEKPKFTLPISILLVIVGLVGVVVGSQLVVNSATFLASAMGVSDRIISLTIVAFGTSLPELVTTITAARRKETDLVVGNVIGSNIFNICIVLGLPVAVFGNIGVGTFEVLDLIMLIFSVVFLLGASGIRHKISRTEGIMMLVVFAAYYGYIVYTALAT